MIYLQKMKSNFYSSSFIEKVTPSMILGFIISFLIFLYFSISSLIIPKLQKSTNKSSINPNIPVITSGIKSIPYNRYTKVIKIAKVTLNLLIIFTLLSV